VIDMMRADTLEESRLNTWKIVMTTDICGGVDGTVQEYCFEI
jgi:hypothetical protein